MKLKRLTAIICAASMLCAVMPVINVSARTAADNKRNAWNNSDLAVGKGYAMMIQSDGTGYITVDSVNTNSSFRKAFDEHVFVDVAVPQNKNETSYITALREDGTVYSRKLSSNASAYVAQTQTGDWNNIVDVDCVDSYALGLTADGNVVSTELSTADGAVAGWSNISMIDAADCYALGLADDGTVKLSKMAANYSGNISKEIIQQNVEEIQNISDVKYVDATSHFVAYVKNDGTVGVTDISDTFGLKDEISEWTDVEKIAAYSTNSIAFACALTSDGRVLITETSQYSPFANASMAAKIEEIRSWENIKDIYVNTIGSGYYVFAVTKDHKVKIAGTNASVSDFERKLLNNDFDTIKTIIPSFEYDNGVCKMSVSLDETYAADKYNVYIAEEDAVTEETPLFTPDDTANLYTAPIEITNPTSFKYVITREFGGVEYPSNVYTLDVTNDMIAPAVHAVTEPGVVDYDEGAVNADGAKIKKVSLEPVFGETVPDDFEIKYIVIENQKNDVINILDGYYKDDIIAICDTYINQTIPEDATSDQKDYIEAVRNLWSRVKQIFDEKNIKTYNAEQGIQLTDSRDVLAWVERTNDDGSRIQGKIVNLRYTFLNKRPNKYPESEYKLAYTEEERADIKEGYVIPRRNTMMAKAGSYMSAVLATNGEVFASRMTNISNSAAQIAVADIGAKVPSSAGDNKWKSVRMWRMISDIGVGEVHVVGLRIDGTVVATGDNSKHQCDVSDWKDIVDIAVGSYHTVGLKKDGTVIGTVSDDGDAEQYGQTAFGTWKSEDAENRVIAIEASDNFTVGLKNNGTVVAAGNNEFGQCNVDEWSDIVDISAGARHTVGLKKDGTVVAVGDNAYGQCDVEDWKNVTSVSASANDTIAITYDGRILHAGNASTGRVSVYGKSNHLKLMQSGLSYFLKSATGSGDQSIGLNISDQSGFQDAAKRRNIFEILEMLGDAGVRFKCAAAGNYTFVLVDEYGIVYNVIHSAGPNNPTDVSYPVINNIQSNSGYLPTIDRGPTIRIDNCYPGVYDYEVPINLVNTTGAERSVFWSKDNSDVYTSNNINPTFNFDGASVLNIAPFEMLGQQRIEYAELKYFYLMQPPRIEFGTESGIQSGPIDLTIQSTRPQKYKVYYTTDGTEPNFVKDSTGIYYPNLSTKEYTGAVKLDKSTVVKARAYYADNIGTSININTDKSTSAVSESYYVIPSEGGEGSTGTIVEGNISNNQDVFWTKDASPYFIKSDVTVQSGSTLRIDEGVEVIFDKGRKLYINGNIISFGTSDNPVVFKGASTSELWGGIEINCQSNNEDTVFRNVEIKGASNALRISAPPTRLAKPVSDLYIHNNENGVNIAGEGVGVSNLRVCDNTKNGISITAKRVTVNNSIIERNDTGINVSGGDAVINNNSIQDNHTNGIYVDGGSASGELTVNGNIIMGNDKPLSETANGKNVGSAENSSLGSKIYDFTNNYWGTTVLADIENTITPAGEKHPKINIDPVLTEIPMGNVVVEISYSKADGTAAANIGEAAGVNASISRDSGAAAAADVITAVYSGGKLEKLFVNNSVVLPSGEGNVKMIENSITPDAKYDECRVFIWNKLNEMQPMAK